MPNSIYCVYPVLDFRLPYFWRIKPSAAGAIVPLSWSLLLSYHLYCSEVAKCCHATDCCKGPGWCSSWNLNCSRKQTQMRQVRAERQKISELQPNSRYRLFQMSIIFMVVLTNARNCGLHLNRTETPYCNFNLIVWPVITIKWMANSIVFIVMVTHQ